MAKKTDLQGNPIQPPKGSTPPPPEGSPKGSPILHPKEEQVQVQVQEQVQEKNNISKDVDFLYSLYPTKCPTKGNSLGKGEKNKKQLEKLLKTKTKEELKEVIEFYVEDCKKTKTYLKNFQTFLNNLPEVVKEEPVIYWRNARDSNSVYRKNTKEELNRYFPNGYENDDLFQKLPKKPDFGELVYY